MEKSVDKKHVHSVECGVRDRPELQGRVLPSPQARCPRLVREHHLPLYHRFPRTFLATSLPETSSPICVTRPQAFLVRKTDTGNASKTSSLLPGTHHPLDGNKQANEYTSVTMTLDESHKTYYILTPLHCWTTVTPMKRTKNRKPFLDLAKTARLAKISRKNSCRVVGPRSSCELAEHRVKASCSGVKIHCPAMAPHSARTMSLMRSRW